MNKEELIRTLCRACADAVVLLEKNLARRRISRQALGTAGGPKKRPFGEGGGGFSTIQKNPQTALSRT